MQTSADTLLRRGVQAPEQAENRTRHVGIDEWAWHRGHRHGTLIVNLDTHRPLVLLPGREQRTLAAWFKKYPEIQVVSRDRGGIYALAARDGAPQAIQVAVRWHLLKNIGDALERMMYRHMPLIRLVATELSPKKQNPEVSLAQMSTLRRPEKIKRFCRINGKGAAEPGILPCRSSRNCFTHRVMVERPTSIALAAAATV